MTLNKAPFPAPLGFPQRGKIRTQVQMLQGAIGIGRIWTLLFSAPALLLASGTPSRHPNLLSCSHYATSPSGAIRTEATPTARTECISGHSKDSALRSRFRLQTRKSVDLRRFELAVGQKPHKFNSSATPLSTFHFPLSTFHSPLSTFHFPLSTLHSPLSTFHFPLSTFHSPLSTMHC